MNNKTTLVVAAVVFALVGTLVFAAIAPYLSDVDAQRAKRGCNENSPDGGDGDPNNDGFRKGCGPNFIKR